VIAVGTILHDTYRLEAELGRGGMGTVFAATHTRLPRRVAVKVLRETTDPQALKRFRREAEICSQIGHGNIVEVFDFNQHDGQPYIVMELLTGESLRQRLKREPVLSPALRVQMVREIGRALAAAHAVGVVHRDLKPENLFLCREDGVEHFKILDFGISKIMGALSLQTRDSALLGTPGYMSPEQARGDMQKVTASADQFSFATIVYEALSGHAAFMAPEDSPYTVLYKIVHKEPAPLFDQPQAVRAVLARAMAKEPHERFADVAEMVTALESALAAGLEPPVAAGLERPLAGLAQSVVAELVRPVTAARRRAWRPALTLALGLGAAGLAATLIARQMLRARPVAIESPSMPTAPTPTPPPPITPPPIMRPTITQPPNVIAPTVTPRVSEPMTVPSVPHDAGAPQRPAKRHPVPRHPSVPATTTPATSNDDELSNPYEVKP
jgi:serine/threonine-protein kinase